MHISISEVILIASDWREFQILRSNIPISRRPKPKNLDRQHYKNQKLNRLKRYMNNQNFFPKEKRSSQPDL